MPGIQTNSGASRAAAGEERDSDLGCMFQHHLASSCLWHVRGEKKKQYHISVSVASLSPIVIYLS